MNISEITARMQSPIQNKKAKSEDADIGKNFTTILMNEMLKTTEIMGEKDGISYTGMFRWQMAQFLAQAMDDKLDFSSIETGNLKNIATDIAKSRGVDPELVDAVIETESSWDQNAISPKGAKGLMQLMEPTAERFSVKDSLDPVQNIQGGVDYLKELLDRFGDTKIALAAYNAGEGNVIKHGGIPPFKETQDYVQKIMKRLNNEVKINNNEE
ncbi:MAG: lytic transglycosylase domain-containing protein [Candidatus Zixiibacteriota bacterium]